MTTKAWAIFRQSPDGKTSVEIKEQCKQCEELLEACCQLIETGDALLDYMHHREPANQERNLEAAIKQAHSVIAKATGELSERSEK